MLSRGKLVQDWNRRLAAAEADGAKKHSLKWLYQMRVRLYRFLLSCYRQGDWRADEPSISTEDTFADASHGETTTILDCPLDGRPAKHAGKMLAVLKSVSAAQDHPAETGPLLGGIAADEWVIVVSARDELRMERCQDLLRQHGIASTWTLQDEITVRLFDLERARRLIRTYQETLKVRIPLPLDLPPRQPVAAVSPWPVCQAALIAAPISAVSLLLLTQCLLVLMREPLLQGPYIGSWLAICYFVSLEICVLRTFLREARRRAERQQASKLAEREKELPARLNDG